MVEPANSVSLCVEAEGYRIPMYTQEISTVEQTEFGPGTINGYGLHEQWAKAMAHVPNTLR